MLIAAYLTKTIHIPENFGLKGYTLVRFGVKDFSKFIQFDHQQTF